MRKLSLAGLIAIGVALVPLTSSADRQGASAQVGERTSPPGEGVLCSWAILSAIATVAQRCHAGEDAALQSELKDSITRFDTYVLANGKPPWTRADIDAFKRQQGHSDAPNASICAQKDGEDMYQALRKVGASEIRKSTDELLARPGKPEWGSCL